jgi:hypothetical protein
MRKGVTETAAWMIQRQGLYQDLPDFLASVIQVIRNDFCPERSKSDGEIVRLHLPGQELVKAIVTLTSAVNQETISRPIRRIEEGKPLDVVPVRVTEKEVPDHGTCSARNQIGAQFAESRASITKEQVAAAPDFDAGRVAAIFAGPIAGCRYRTARAPEFDENAHLYSS